MRANDRRANKVPAEYGAKAITADEALGDSKNKAVLDTLKVLPTVRGLALGAFGEFSESINVLIEEMAHEGALKNPGKFGQNNYKAAFGKYSLVAKASAGASCVHHGSQVALCRTWVYRRHRPAAGCGAPCLDPSPGRLAGRRRLPPEREGDCRPHLRGFECA